MTRIIAGERKGLKLNNPPGRTIRPTTDRVKEWIFSVLYNVGDLTVLDLYCGAGNLGLEALSRGASHCTFVDNSSRSISLTKSNVSLSRLSDNSAVVQSDVFKYLQRTKNSFDLIFADPPYKSAKPAMLIPLVCERLTPGGLLIFEGASPVETDLSDPYEILRSKSMGRTVVSIIGATS